MDLIASKAYKIFVEELGSHLAKAHFCFDSHEIISQQELTHASACFHTIRGGAGFFGLEEIANTAGKLERMLTLPDLDLKESLPEIKTLIARLDQLATQIPTPPQESKTDA